MLGKRVSIGLLTAPELTCVLKKKGIRQLVACLGYAFQWSNGIHQNVCLAIVLLSEGDHLEYYIAKWR